MIDDNSTDRPKLLGDPQARAERLALLQCEHIKPLTDFVEGLRQEVGETAQIPNFDPWDGGFRAEILFLLEAPGAKAVQSGFISRNNPDQTAKNFFEICAEAGISRRRSVVWNIVPWYIGNGSKIRSANKADLCSGSSSLSRFLELLPHLKIIVLVGRKAESAEKIIRPVLPKIRIFKSFHPSPLFVNRVPGNRQLILEVFRQAALVLNNETAD